MRLHMGLVAALAPLGDVVRGSHLESVAQHFDIKHWQTPRLDLSAARNERLLVFDDFQAFEYYNYKGQQLFTGQEQHQGSSLIYYSEGTYVQLAKLDDDTVVRRIVPFGSDSFILSGTGKLQDQRLEHQLMYNLSTLEVTEILPQSLESVNDILVDGDMVYFGGQFTYSDGNKSGHSAVQWNATSRTTSLLPFGGFGRGSSVNNILKLSGSGVLFVGRFSNLEAASYAETASVLASTEKPQLNVTTIETNALTSLRYSTITSDGHLDKGKFICPTSNDDSWFVPHSGDGPARGELNIKVLHRIIPSKIRIYNSKKNGNEIKLFRIVTSPSQSIMNMTYIDPNTGELATCDAWCPLMPRSNLTSKAAESGPADVARLVNDEKVLIKWTPDYQEFAFINQIHMEEIKFIALDSYGNNVGLVGVELFQTEYDAYVNSTLNQPNCGEQQLSPFSTTANIWHQGATDASYLSANVVESNPMVNVKPVIPHSGTYTLNLYTPGCEDDGTCDYRGIVNVTLLASNGTTLMTRWIYQNNYRLKYDPLYTGHLDPNPTVRMEWVSPINSAVNRKIMVADRVSAIIDSLDGLDDIRHPREKSLNGLFQYTPAGSSLDNGIQKYINKDPQTDMPEGVSLVGQVYDGKLILGVKSTGHIAVVTPKGTDWNDVDVTRQDVPGSLNGISPYSKGLVFTGKFNLSSGPSSALHYDGNFGSFFDLNSETSSIINMTIDGSELLLFNNKFIYNTSTSQMLTSSMFQLSALSAAANSNNDLLFTGSIADIKHGSAHGAVALDAEGNIFTSGTPSISGARVHRGVYLNDTATAYAYYSVSPNSSVATGGVVIETPGNNFNLSNNIATVREMIYVKKTNFLVISTNEVEGTPGALILYDLRTLQEVAREKLNPGERINSIVLFGEDNTLLVGGSFEKDGCHDLCLYNFVKRSWSAFASGLISGEIKQLQFVNNRNLIAVGSMTVQSRPNILFLNFDLVRSRVVEQHEQPNGRAFNSVLTIGDSGDEYVAEDGKQVWHYSGSEWKTVTPLSGGQIRIDGISLLMLNNPRSQNKRNRVGNELVVIHGQMNSSEYGEINAMHYNFENWEPYYFTIGSSAREEFNVPRGQIFLNQDISRQTTTSLPLEVVVSDSPPTAEPKRKLAKGYVVLIALGLALATIALLGIIGVILAYAFGDHNAYQPLKPRINEDEMLKTVPPEKLMKFI
ncbi:AGR095Wp [Eremothecium gossypii ATCC 10895]|uniref:AGR095Wp n=1 Tax=Eremothecium gossypii (strain ATCC 10895 / CBS 109.51 / FGSC 9923 / NRRL Y-1056) TaxID=284811 RepID=Q74ZV4_EREGS|nr:AGR095Wp [Eremothecium gossypii ATCC 10895]AAS54584.1 AGR095Wp [Eremothecium gossypii ATCC 10895]AEY98915.1 FAGR095Wp [Eremothecium gossypii FDAG1]